MISSFAQSYPETPGELVTSLDNFGLNLVQDFDEDEDVNQTTLEKNLAFQIQRLKVKNISRDVVFEQNQSSISLPHMIFDKVSDQLFLFP